MEPTNDEPEYPDEFVRAFPATPVGTSRFGDYELLQVVHNEGLSRVIKARHARTGELVAIKFCSEEGSKDRFKREIEYTRWIQNPNVIKIEEDGQTRGGFTRYHVTRWIRGRNLEEILKDRSVGTERKLELFAKLCGIVSYLHAEHYASRDIKPSNVMHDEEADELVLLDMGLAHFQREQRKITMTDGRPFGTTGFIPHWAYDDDGDDHDHARWRKEYVSQWDVFSLGVFLVVSLTRIWPAFGKDENFTPDGARELLEQRLPADRRFDDLIAKALALDPRETYPHALALHLDLQTALKMPAIPRRTKDPIPLPEPEGSQKATVVPIRISKPALSKRVGFACLALILLGTAGWYGIHHGKFENLFAEVDSTPVPIQGVTNNPPVFPPRDTNILNLNRALLSINVTPANADIRIVDHGANAQIVTQWLNVTNPVEFALRADDHTDYSLEVSKERYATNTQAIGPDTGTVHVRLQPLLGSAKLSSAPTKDHPWRNSLEMSFVPLSGTKHLICIYETRRGDYEAYAKDKPGIDDSWRAAAIGEHPAGHKSDHPVVNVSWKDAVAFCEWLTERERAGGFIPLGSRYRLPTDAEWSLAVGLTEPFDGSPAHKEMMLLISLERINRTEYPWGVHWPPPPRAGNFCDETVNSVEASSQFIKGYRDGFVTTSPVGQFSMNPHGLYDLAGNVWEWCEDWYDPSSRKKQRVSRGASWFDHNPQFLHSAKRNREERGVHIGFRVILDEWEGK